MWRCILHSDLVLLSSSSLIAPRVVPGHKVCRFFEELAIDALTLYITVLPRRDGQRAGTPMVRLAAATGLSMMDLDDVRIHIGEFRLLNKFVRPEEALDMVASNFIRQV